MEDDGGDANRSHKIRFKFDGLSVKQQNACNELTLLAAETVSPAKIT
jgi:hypothetical protein